MQPRAYTWVASRAPTLPAAGLLCLVGSLQPQSQPKHCIVLYCGMHATQCRPKSTGHAPAQLREAAGADFCEREVAPAPCKADAQLPGSDWEWAADWEVPPLPRCCNPSLHAGRMLIE